MSFKSNGYTWGLDDFKTLMGRLDALVVFDVMEPECSFFVCVEGRCRGVIFLSRMHLLPCI